jgi:hypothetical protein
MTIAIIIVDITIIIEFLMRIYKKKERGFTRMLHMHFKRKKNKKNKNENRNGIDHR